MTEPQTPRGISPRLPFVLLALMTLAAFGGPVVIGIVLRGGPSPRWPPDRPLEWLTFTGICAFVLGIMALSVMILVRNQRDVERLKQDR